MLQELHEAGEERWGTDEETFNRIFSVNDFYTLNRVWTEYVKVSVQPEALHGIALIEVSKVVAAFVSQSCQLHLTQQEQKKAILPTPECHLLLL